MRTPLLTVELRTEHDVVAARQRAREIAELLGLAGTEQTRIATAVSEIARNAFRYAGGGHVDYALEADAQGSRLAVVVRDSGRGIADLDAVLEGRYRSSTGMGMGIVGARRIMDRFRITTAPGAGTRVEMAKALPSSIIVDETILRRISEALERRRSSTVFEEVRWQNQELLGALGELRARQEELLQLNRELEDTNRGVVALYAELDDRMSQLRRANSLRAQFTSYLSHEFRTPLDSMIALSGLLIDRMDGELTAEQEKQVEYIRRSARDLLGLVDDMLDTARMETGQIPVRPERFSVGDLFSSLRATLRPLSPAASVALVFDETADLPELYTDAAKLSQILRNLVSNALKFTERGEVRVAAALDGDRIVFTVSDTGVGIEPEMREWIFEDFTRVEHGGRKVKGTGLGLPLSRKLARLLGGEVSVESEPGQGSRFRLVVPRELPGEEPERRESA